MCRNYSVVNVEKGQVEVTRMSCPGSQITCQLKVGNTLWMATEVRTIQTAVTSCNQELGLFFSCSSFFTSYQNWTTVKYFPDYLFKIDQGPIFYFCGSAWGVKPINWIGSVCIKCTSFFFFTKLKVWTKQARFESTLTQNMFDVI